MVIPAKLHPIYLIFETMIKYKSKLENTSKNLSKEHKDAWEKWMAMKRQQLKEKKVQEEREKKLKEVELEKERLKKETADLNRLIWLRKKEDLRKAEKLKKQKELEALKKEKSEKEKKSQEAVNKWMSEAKYKAKPVRSNQGLASLTAYAPTFVNPRPWKGPIEA